MLLKNTIYFLTLIYSVCCLAACANRAPLQGGIRDEIAPKPDSLLSTKNFQTNFQKQPIELVFKEWVVLDNAETQIIVSPPLEFPLKTTIKGKTVRLRFDEKEKIRENATYTIQFGNAIKDFTEGNVPKDLRFLFSTGATLDSVSLTGEVVNAFSFEPVENALVMLYENTADSVVRKDRPFYLAKTDKTGQFRLENLKNGKFKAFALIETNGNYKYDSDGEQIAFSDTLINTAIRKPLNMRMFEGKRKIQVKNNDFSQQNLARILINQSPEGIEIKSLSNVPIVTEMDKDTLKIWHKTDAKFWKLLLTKGQSFQDTVTVRASAKPTKPKLHAIRVGGGEFQHPTKNTEIAFNYPIDSLMNAKFQLFEDSVRVPVFPKVSLHPTSKRRLVVAHAWREGKRYTLQMPKNAVKDWFGNTSDSLKIVFGVITRKETGNLNLTLENLNPTKNYILQLINSSNVMVEERPNVSGKATSQQIFSFLTPDSYKIRVITDENRNNRWDIGDYDLKKQPEPILLQKIEQAIRAGWDVEAQVKIGDW
jgi:Bacterial Ig-like domain